MTKNIKEFLEMFSTEELRRREILRVGKENTLLLQGKSIPPLLKLMEEKGIKKLVYPDLDWYLDDKGNFRNPLSKDKKGIKEGHYKDLEREGGPVFDSCNPIFNPHYKKTLNGKPSLKKTEESSVIEERKKSPDSILHLIEKKKQIILYGPPGTGKTYDTKELAVKILGGDSEDTYTEYEKYRKEGRIEFITFHPSYSYEEFIEGITVKIEGENVATDSPRYILRRGIFKDICKRALDSATGLSGKDWIDTYKKYLSKNKVDFKNAPKYVLIIDEINRGDMAKIFGELITLLETDKQLWEDNELIVKLPNSNDEFGVPPNIYIIGTMNTADRSLALLDVALRRRFGFIEMSLKFDILMRHIENKRDEGDMDDETYALLRKSIDVIEKGINIEICKDKSIGRDRQIGHAFLFKVDTVDDMVLVWRYEILPLLEEYCYSDYPKINQILFDDHSDNEFISRAKGIGEINSSNLQRMLDKIKIRE